MPPLSVLMEMAFLLQISASPIEVNFNADMNEKPENIYSIYNPTITTRWVISIIFTHSEWVILSKTTHSEWAFLEKRLLFTVLDLYFFRQLTSHQSITANAVGTYISTQSSSYYDEGSPYQYDVKGKTASLLSEMMTEAIYALRRLGLYLQAHYEQLPRRCIRPEQDNGIMK